MATIDRATDGAILIDGSDISKMKDAELSAFRRDKLGFIFQDYNLLDTLTSKENILLPISFGKVNKKEAEARFTEIADDSQASRILHISIRMKFQVGRNNVHRRHVHLLTNLQWYLRMNRRAHLIRNQHLHF